MARKQKTDYTGLFWIGALVALGASSEDERQAGASSRTAPPKAKRSPSPSPGPVLPSPSRSKPKPPVRVAPPPRAPAPPPVKKSPAVKYQAKVVRDLTTPLASGIATLRKLEQSGPSSWKVQGDVGNWRIATGREPQYGSFVRGVPEGPDNPLPIYEGRTDQYFYILQNPFTAVDIRTVPSFQREYTKATGLHPSTFAAMKVYRAPIFLYYKVAENDKGMFSAEYDAIIVSSKDQVMVEQRSWKWPPVPYALTIFAKNNDDADKIAAAWNGALAHNQSLPTKDPIILQFNE